MATNPVENTAYLPQPGFEAPQVATSTIANWSADSLPEATPTATKSRRDSKTARARSWLGSFMSSSSWTTGTSGETGDAVVTVSTEVATTAETTEVKAPSQIEHCLVIPTFGYRDPENPTKWNVDIRGWVYAIKQNSMRKKFIKSVTKRIFSRTIEADPQSALVFLDKRLDMYLTRTAESVVNATLSEGPMDPTREDMHPYEIRSDGLKARVIAEPPQPTAAPDVVEVRSTTVTLEFKEDKTTPPALPPRAEFSASTTVTTGSLTVPPSPSRGSSSDDGLGTSPGDDSTLDEMLEADDDEEEEEEEIELPAPPVGLEGQFKTDANGNFTGTFRVSDETVAKWKESAAVKNSNGHLHIKVVVSRDRQKYQAFGSVELLDRQGISLISDVDDTIKHSNIGSGASAMFANAMLEAPKDLPGMADAYNNLWKAGAAVHYVSAAPWQVFPTVVDLLRRNRFPPGSFHMRTIFFSDSSFKNAFQPSNHGKMQNINRILQQFPHRKFILVGDSGEDDMFTYAYFKRQYPEQVLAIFIRDVQAISQSEAGKERLSPEALVRLSQAPFEFPASPRSPSKETPDGGLPRLKIDPAVDPVTMMESRLRFAFAGFDPDMWSIFTNGAEDLGQQVRSGGTKAVMMA